MGRCGRVLDRYKKKVTGTSVDRRAVERWRLEGNPTGEMTMQGWMEGLLDERG